MMKDKKVTVENMQTTEKNSILDDQSKKEEFSSEGNENLSVQGTIKRKTINGKYAGRKKQKTEPEKIINVSVPVSLYEQMNIAKLKYNNNMTAYVNYLIRQDIEKNLSIYKQVQKLLNL